MTPEQLEAYGRMTHLQKGFVKALEEGYSPKESYYRAGGTASTDRVAATCTSTMLADANVREFRRLMDVEDLDAMTMSHAEMKRRLAEIARAKLPKLAKIKKHLIGYDDDGNEQYVDRVELTDFDDVDEGELGAVSEITQKEHGISLKMHSPLQAMKQLAELSGMDAPKRTEISGRGGAAIKITSIDPAEAAQQYMDLMG